MGLIFWIKEKLALRKAKQEEKKHLVDDDDLNRIDKDFTNYSSRLRQIISKQQKKPKK